MEQNSYLCIAAFFNAFPIPFNAGHVTTRTVASCVVFSSGFDFLLGVALFVVAIPAGG